MALPIWVPVAYIALLVLSLATFSRIYRARSAQRLAGGAAAAPWFPEGHPERDIYQSLVMACAEAEADQIELEQEQSGEKQKKEEAADASAGKRPKIPDEVLKAALLNRAMADVRRIIRMRDDKQALQALLQRGSLGDETMERFTLAEKELEAEILDVVSEANTFKDGWGQIIFPTASEMVSHLKHKDIYYAIQHQRTAEGELTSLGRYGDGLIARLQDSSHFSSLSPRPRPHPLPSPPPLLKFVPRAAQSKSSRKPASPSRNRRSSSRRC